MAHGAPPMHAIESCTGIKKGTTVPSPGIHQSTSQESARRHPPITTVYLWQPKNKKGAERTYNTYANPRWCQMMKTEKIPKSRHTSIGHLPLLKLFSHDGKLHTTIEREENVHGLAPLGTHTPTQPPSNIVLTDTNEENLSSSSL